MRPIHWIALLILAACRTLAAEGHSPIRVYRDSVEFVDADDKVLRVLPLGTTVTTRDYVPPERIITIGSRTIVGQPNHHELAKGSWSDSGFVSPDGGAVAVLEWETERDQPSSSYETCADSIKREGSRIVLYGETGEELWSRDLGTPDLADARVFVAPGGAPVVISCKQGLIALGANRQPHALKGHAQAALFTHDGRFALLNQTADGGFMTPEQGLIRASVLDLEEGRWVKEGIRFKRDAYYLAKAFSWDGQRVALLDRTAYPDPIAE